MFTFSLIHFQLNELTEGSRMFLFNQIMCVSLLLVLEFQHMVLLLFQPDLQPCFVVTFSLQT